MKLTNDKTVDELKIQVAIGVIIGITIEFIKTIVELLTFYINNL